MGTESIVERVVAWFHQHARDLPWRKHRTPYGTWISEVMLQQTQVKTVLPYWERWMTLFPDIPSLAGASEQAVLKAWEGLGYYSRARNLHAAARQMVREHGGLFPRGFAQILALPGVGRYTAGAIASLAYGDEAAILDGNVARVLARLFAIPGSIKNRRVQARLWRISARLAKVAHSRQSSGPCNEGLMELGATICTPREPQCSSCPVRGDCTAAGTGQVARFPSRNRPAKMRQRFFAVLIALRGPLVLVRQRGDKGVNSGLWEFPNLELSSAQFENPGLAALWPGARWAAGLVEVACLRHSITTSRITLRACAGQLRGPARDFARSLQAEWVPREKLESLPFTGAHAKLRALIPEMQGSGSARNTGGPA